MRQKDPDKNKSVSYTGNKSVIVHSLPVGVPCMIKMLINWKKCL